MSSCNLHLYFLQNDRDLLRATAVTQGWNEYQNNSQHRRLTQEKKILPPLLQGLRPMTLQSRDRHSTIELSQLPMGKASITPSCLLYMRFPECSRWEANIIHLARSKHRRFKRKHIMRASALFTSFYGNPAPSYHIHASSLTVLLVNQKREQTMLLF